MSSRIYTSFTLETILATAFGRQVNIQRGELDEFSMAMESMLAGFVDGQQEYIVLLNSEFTVTVSVIILSILLTCLFKLINTLRITVAGV